MRRASAPAREGARAQPLGLVVDDRFELCEEIGDHRELLVAVAGAQLGHRQVGGVDVAANPIGAKRRLGVVPLHNKLDRSITVWENLYLHCQLLWALIRELRDQDLPQSRNCLPVRLMNTVSRLTGSTETPVVAHGRWHDRGDGVLAAVGKHPQLSVVLGAGRRHLGQV